MPSSPCRRCVFANCSKCAASRHPGFSAGVAWFSDVIKDWGLNGLSTPRYMGDWCVCCLSQVKHRLFSKHRSDTVERLSTLALQPGVWHDNQNEEFKGLSQAVLDCGLAQYWSDEHTPGYPLGPHRNGNWGWPFETDQHSDTRRRMLREIAEIWRSLP